MKKLFLLLFLSLSTGLLFTACNDDDDNTPQSVVDLAQSNADLSILVDALVRADLVTTLDGPGPFTVLAPTNAAFTTLLSNLGFNSLNDVPVDVLAVNLRTRKRHRQTVEAGKDAVFKNLDKDNYSIYVHCAVYEREGAESQQVDARKTPKTIQFNFRPRTILQSTNTFLFGFLCYRTPCSPDPDPDADFVD